MKLRILKLCLPLCALLLLLTGCLPQSGEDFYALPQLPADYLALQQKINEVMNALGAEYAAPTSGSNVQTLQLQDLDGDGIQESAIAFFRVANEEKPLKIYIFRQDEATETYETAWIIEGDGASIYSVAYENLGGGEEKELIVSWQMSAKVHSLAAYSLSEGAEPIELMRSGYTAASVVDLDRDNEREIVIIQLDTAENHSRAEFYDYTDGLMLLSSTAPLSLGITDISAAKPGYLLDSLPALFISSDYETLDGLSGRLTDIIAIRDNALTNITLDDATGMSYSTARSYREFTSVNGLDINSDAILELPMPEALPIIEEQASPFYLFHWYQYSLDGASQLVCTTFHNYDDGWYLVLPDSWTGQITAARRDTNSSSASSERAITFYHWTGPEAEPEPFLTIYRLSGANRVYRASREGRFRLFETIDVVYAAEFHACSWNCGLDEDSLRGQVYRIKQDWSSES